MFKLSWKPVISAIAYAFTSFDDDYVMQRAISGFRQCATLAGKFKLPEVFDYIVMSLSHATGLIADEEGSRPKSLNFPVVEVEEQSVTVSTLSIKFGTNFRAQLAAVVLFTIANGNGNAIRDGWVQVGANALFNTQSPLIRLPNRSSRCSKLFSFTVCFPTGCLEWKSS
jgi:brefeldin A-resistance guanine nucleotide exchange factor 1